MKNLKKLLFALGTASILVTGGAMTALAETNIAAESDFVYTPIRVYGTAQKLTDGRLHLTNSSTDSINDIVVTTQNSLILDAVSGMPVSYEDIQEGSFVYAYVGPAMALSLPPIANADIVLVNIPADYKVPSYVIVKSLDMHEDGSATLTANDGQVYDIPADCSVIPYLTRQMIYVDSLTPGSASSGRTAIPILQTASCVLTPIRLTTQSPLNLPRILILKPLSSSDGPTRMETGTTTTLRDSFTKAGWN